MSRRVLIIPDKFKGTLTARQAAEAIAEGWSKARPDDELELLPMSDGGDGFGQILGEILGAEARTVETVDAAHQPCTASWWWLADSKTAIIESANVIGLAMLPNGEFHPRDLDSQGLAAVLQAASDAGAKRCVIGIGGSATNDAGTGMARGLGWQFAGSAPIEHWPDLTRLESIERPTAPLGIPRLEVAVDVQNPLTGPHGCSAIYGPQKGLAPDEIEPADAALLRLAEISAKDLDTRADTPGDGAAGGLGFGLRCFAGGILRPGFDLFAEQVGLIDRLKEFDLVITGEGSIDPSTLMGKGVGELAARCRELELPCIGLGGVVSDSNEVAQAFTTAAGVVNEVADEEASHKDPTGCLSRLAEKVGTTVWQPGTEN